MSGAFDTSTVETQEASPTTDAPPSEWTSEMISQFYHRNARWILLGVLATFPIIHLGSEALEVDNRPETWLSDDAEIRAEYEEFREDFGAEESVLIAFPREAASLSLLEAIRLRIEQLESVTNCWSEDRMQRELRNLGATDEEITTAAVGLFRSPSGHLQALIVAPSETGIEDRAGMVSEIRGILDDAQLDEAKLHLAGAPVIVAELNELGSRENNKRFLLITFAICTALLWASVREIKLAGGLLLIILWALLTSMAVVHFAGGKMNFILSALPVMTMIFTMAICIHLLHYFRESSDCADPLATAFKLALRPCVLATTTTVVGLLSLSTSEIFPVRQFGVAAAAGSVIALIAGLGITPALLIFLDMKPERISDRAWPAGLTNAIIRRGRLVAVASLIVVGIASCGLFWLQTHIDALDFLPSDNKVLTDLHVIESELTSTSSVEAVVEFTDEDQPFLERMAEVQRIAQLLQSHDAVRSTTSLATFFPKGDNTSTWDVLSMLSAAKSKQGEKNSFIAEGGRLWRISARVRKSAGISPTVLQHELEAITSQEQIRYTGISPLLEQTQGAIFSGFRESFLGAFVIITVVMMVSLRSFTAGLVAMVPNLTPIALVFGLLGWMGIPIDIGMMMTGSVALGIAVDGTFHFLVAYRQRVTAGDSSAMASRFALTHTGTPIFLATLIAGIGMLALTLSPFGPTAAFGAMMTAMLLAAIVGDLVLLPAVLAWNGEPDSETRNEDHATDVTATIPSPHLNRASIRNAS